MGSAIVYTGQPGTADAAIYTGPAGGIILSQIYAANLTGRVLASRLARTHTPEHLLLAAIGLVLAGLPCLLAATSAVAAVAGIALVGTGIGALFPLTSSLHVQASGHTADSALGEVLTIAALGQIAGPLLAGAIAQASSLRAGLLVLPALALLAAAGLEVRRRSGRRGARRWLARSPRASRACRGARSAP